MRQYQNRDRVFDHPLNILPDATKPQLTSGNIESKKQYISMPSLWRNYYDVIGYSRDARTGQVWLTPILYNSDELHDAYFMSPETDGTISVKEDADRRTLTLRTTNGMEVNGLHLRDDFADPVAVRVNGKACRVRRTGEGYARELVVDWKGKATAKGLCIEVIGKRKADVDYTPAMPDRDFATAFQLNTMSPFEGLYAAKADRQAGTQVLDTYVTSCNNFDYLQFSNVDFAKGGATSVIVRVNSRHADSELEVALDDNAGAAVAAFKLPCTNGEWQEIEVPVSKVKGIHNVVFRFFGSHSDSLMDIDYVRFK